MGVFDSIWVKFKCPSCGEENPKEEIQTKLGERMLENWTIGEETSIRQGVYVEDHVPWCCALEPSEDPSKGGIYIGGKLHRYKDDYWTLYFRITVLRHRILEKVELLKPCPKCRGEKFLNGKEMREAWVKVIKESAGIIAKPEIEPLKCDVCAGEGYLDEVVSAMEKIDLPPPAEE